MMEGAEVKTFELRDRATMIPVMCIFISMSEVKDPDRFLMQRAGWGGGQSPMYMININDGRCQWNAMEWNLEPYITAHQYIYENWYQLNGGEVIDAEFIRGESKVPKTSERFI